MSDETKTAVRDAAEQNIRERINDLVRALDVRYPDSDVARIAFERFAIAIQRAVLVDITAASSPSASAEPTNDVYVDGPGGSVDGPSAGQADNILGKHHYNAAESTHNRRTREGEEDAERFDGVS